MVIPFHSGSGSQYIKWGQTFGKGDVVTALLDLEKHSILYGHRGREGVVRRRKGQLGAGSSWTLSL